MSTHSSLDNYIYVFASATLIICYFVKKALVIQGLLADYDAKSIGVGLGCDRMPSK